MRKGAKKNVKKTKDQYQELLQDFYDALGYQEKDGTLLVGGATKKTVPLAKGN